MITTIHADTVSKEITFNTTAMHNTDSQDDALDIDVLMGKLSISSRDKPQLPNLNAPSPMEVPPPRPKAKRDSRKQWGDSIKRSCKASFKIKFLHHLPHVTEIYIIHRRHLNENGLVVHGDFNWR